MSFKDYILFTIIMFVIQDICLKIEFKINKNLFYDLYIKKSKYEKELKEAKDGKI